MSEQPKPKWAVECQLCKDSLTIIGSVHKDTNEEELKTHLVRLMAEHVKNMEMSKGNKWNCFDPNDPTDKKLEKEIRAKWMAKLKPLPDLSAKLRAELEHLEHPVDEKRARRRRVSRLFPHHPLETPPIR